MALSIHETNWLVVLSEPKLEPHLCGLIVIELEARYEYDLVIFKQLNSF
jgi:hypothetical protein